MPRTIEATKNNIQERSGRNAIFIVRRQNANNPAFTDHWAIFPDGTYGYMSQAGELDKTKVFDIAEAQNIPTDIKRQLDSYRESNNYMARMMRAYSWRW